MLIWPEDFTLPVFRCAFIGLLLLISPFSLADIYKWVDEHGKIHFSETAPENNAAEKMDEKLQETGNFVNYPEIPASASHSTMPTAGETPVSPAQPLQINIELIDYELSAATLASIRSNINAMYYAYQLWFGWPDKAQYPVNIKLFGRLKPFEDYQRLKNYTVINRSFYSGTPNREIIMTGVIESEALITLYHEVSHAILNMQQYNTSKWINEGLAEVFSNHKGIRNQLPVLSTDEKWVYILKQMLAKNSLQNISEYLSISNAQWKNTSRLEENSYYMIAWSIMYFMATHETGRDTLKALFAINQQQPLHNKNLIQQIDQRYPGGIKKLDADWRQWINTLP